MNGRLTRIAQGAFYAFFTGLVLLTPFSISAIEIISLLLLAAWLLGAHRPPAGSDAAASPAARATLWALLLYVAVCALSLTQSKFPSISWNGLIGKTAQYALLFLFAFYAMKHRRGPSWAVRSVLAAAWLVVLYSLWQEIVIFRAGPISTILDPIRPRITLDYLRMVGPYKNPNDLATYLMVTSLLVIALLTESERRLPVHLGTLGFLLVGCLIWTLSRGALLGFLTGMLFLLGLYSRRRKSLLILLGILAAASTFILFLSSSNWRELITLADIGSKDRSVMWSTGWAMFRDKPFLGHGINTFMANYQTYAGDRHSPAYAHNCYLQIAAESGAVGLASFFLFLLCLGIICRQALRRPRQSLPPRSAALRPVLIGLAAGTLAFLVQSAFDTNLYAVRQATLFWTFAGMVLGISELLVPSPQHP